MASLEKINLCLRELFEKRIWASVSVSESIGVSGTLCRFRDGVIRSMHVLRCHMIMTWSLRSVLTRITLTQKMSRKLRE